MFAYDTQLFHGTVDSFKEDFKILETYSKAYGAKININKKNALKIGKWKKN